MRNQTIIASCLLLLCSTSPSWAQAESPPATWSADYWERTQRAIKEARDQGQRQEAEGRCASLIPYTEAQAVPALQAYADHLDTLRPGAGNLVRGHAQRLAQVQASNRSGKAEASTYLGFSPTTDIVNYADALTQAGRSADAQAMQALAAAYQHSQQVYVQRVLLMRQGKDPRGEC